MLMKALALIGKTLSLAVKCLFFPVTYTYRRLTRRIKKNRRDKNDFPGVYIVSNSACTIKIGRSKHVRRRLRAYRGYQ